MRVSLLRGRDEVLPAGRLLPREARRRDAVAPGDRRRVAPRAGPSGPAARRTTRGILRGARPDRSITMRFRAPSRASSFVPGVALAALLVVAGCSLPSGNAAATPVAGAGDPTTENRTAGAFTSVSADAGINLVVSSGATRSVKVIAQPNLLPLVRTDVVNGQLTATIVAPGVSTTRPVTVSVVVPTLGALSLDGGAQGTVQLQADLLSITLDGGATLQGIGTVSHLALTAQGDATAKLGDLAADSVTVTMGGGAQATLNVKTAITGSADGGATITLATSPGSMTVKTSGGATVTGG